MGFNEKMTTLADAIRGKTNQTKDLTLDEMATSVESIEVGGSSAAFIDVTELPTENIKEDCFYRLLTGVFIFNRNTSDIWYCNVVDVLPEVGQPVLSGDLSAIENANLTVYLNMSDNAVYGYVADELSAIFGAPAGWYPIDVLMQGAGYTFNGIITDIEDDPEDDTFRVLLSKDFYMYHNEWCKVPFAYEKAPKVNITWDGNMEGKIALDMSLLGYENVYFVKVSDDVFTTDEVIGWGYQGKNYDDGGSFDREVYYDSLDTETYPGAFTIDDYIVILHDADTLAAALGIPTGIYTNGTYFFLNSEQGHISSFTSPPRITKIDGKYLYLESVLDQVAFSGDYYDLNNRPTIYSDVIRYDINQSLSSSNKQRARTNIDVYSKSEVDSRVNTLVKSEIDNLDLVNYGTVQSMIQDSGFVTNTEVQSMIDTAIGTAIGGSY